MASVNFFIIQEAFTLETYRKDYQQFQILKLVGDM